VAHDEQSALGNAGAPPRIEWRGVKYTFSYRTQQMKAKVVRAAKESAASELRELKSLIEPAEHQRSMQEYKDACINGEFHFDSERTLKFRGTPRGKLAELRAMLGDAADKLSDQDLDRFAIEKEQDIELIVITIQQNVSDLLKASGYDPEAEQARVKLELGWPSDGTEPNEAQVVELNRRMNEYAGTIDPKVKAQVAELVGILG
jgi:hypothetical protein